MSIRIHQLSKKIGMENKELIALLQERGFNVTSASNTIDNISAESLVDEFTAKAEEAGAAAASTTGAAEDSSVTASKESDEDGKSGGPEHPPARPAVLPAGVFVKSAEQVAKEKEEAKAAARPQPAPPPTPAAAP
ncbi:MAG: translation initiation factor IF-2, partial [Puniceicoccaceae bacterium]